MNYGVVILAAGRSERMGTLKPLLELGERTLLEHIFSNPFISYPNIRPVVVLGYQAETIRKRISIPIQWVDNPRFQEGRTTSIQCGLRQLPEDTQGAFIWPVDCPLVPAFVLSRLVSVFSSPEDIIIPSYRFRRGHPSLIGSAFFADILSFQDDQSLRDLYRMYPDRIRHVETNTETILQNLNTPEDFHTLKKQYESRGLEKEM